MAHLMRRTQAGDRTAYRALLGLAAAMLKRVFRHRVPEAALDDLVQETLLSLHRKRDSWDPERPFLPWLSAIARYRWVDHLRRVYRANESLIDGDLAAPDSSEALAARFGVDKLLALLPPAQAAAIRATRIEGLSTTEAAARLGQSESLIKVNVHRGLKRLAALVEEVRS